MPGTFARVSLAAAAAVAGTVATGWASPVAAAPTVVPEPTQPACNPLADGEVIYRANTYNATYGGSTGTVYLDYSPHCRYSWAAIRLNQPLTALQGASAMITNSANRIDTVTQKRCDVAVGATTCTTGPVNANGYYSAAYGVSWKLVNGRQTFWEALTPWF